MNKTKIDWADSSWNPVTGCLHDCPYCYARTMANRFGSHIQTDGATEILMGSCVDYDTERALPYPYDFKPTFHKYRLVDYKNKKGRTIFVCSMADLFGEWVPDEWIAEVFKACEAAPQHRYLFLTKNPKRYKEIQFKIPLPTSDRYWYGTTVTGSENENRHVIEGYNTFVSMEPLLKKPINIEKWVKEVQWIIVGAETGNRKDKVIPKREWIEDIALKCKASGTPVFMKSSLREIMGDDFIQQYPWEAQK